MNISADYTTMNISSIYERLSSGKQINSAADDAAGLAISEKIGALAQGLATGNNNSEDMKNLLKTAEGGLENISDSLQRIRELSIQASSGIYNDSDKAIMQDEVSQLLGHIKDSAKGTEYNTMKLLDGSFANKHTASNPDGSGMTIHLEDTSLASLGIEGYDLTGDFDISTIDDALQRVNDSRAKIGASQNRLDYTINSNSTAYVNQMDALSRIRDTDIAKESMRLNTANVISQYKTFMQKAQMQQAGSALSVLL